MSHQHNYFNQHSLQSPNGNHGFQSPSQIGGLPNGHISPQFNAVPKTLSPRISTPQTLGPQVRPEANKMGVPQMNGLPPNQRYARPMHPAAPRGPSPIQSPMKRSPLVTPTSSSYFHGSTPVQSPSATPATSLPGRYPQASQTNISNRAPQPQAHHGNQMQINQKPTSQPSSLPNSNQARSTPGRRHYPQQVAPSIPVARTPNPSQVISPDQPIQQPAPNNSYSNTTPLVPNIRNQNPAYQDPRARVEQQQKQNTTLMGRLSVEQSPTYGVNLLESKQIVPEEEIKPPTPPLSHGMDARNVNPEIMRCSLNAVPQTSSLLKQCKLPFSIYVHPFKENMNIPVVSSVITRCRSCRSYLNPFVSIPDNRRWQCNMCYRMNELPEELSYNAKTRQYTDIRQRPELSSASVEFIAPSEYMVRPPQPSVFIFALDVSFNAINNGYLHHACTIIKENIDDLPGDARTKIAFITFNSTIHFYSLKNAQSQPQMIRMSDLDDVFLPVPDGLVVNVKENKDMILQLLESLPTSFDQDNDTNCCTGAALLAGRKMASSTGGRVTLFQTCLPTVGPGKLSHRETSGISASSKDVQFLNPSTDYYKKLALDCAGEQIAIDIFLLAGQYCDLASFSGASRHSSGAIHYFPEFHATKNLPMLEKFKHDLKRYLTRNIGFEAVMRLRSTKGLAIHTFHGNFFVRSTDLLSLPNVNPDHSFGMQIAIEESLEESSMVAFQTALLYTTTKGERRIRVHTLALPITTKLSDIYAYADQQTAICSLSKLAVDRTLMSSLGDARECLMNACIDCLKVYRTEISGQKNTTAVIAPYQLRLLPLLVLALMKNDAFKLGSNSSLDHRIYTLLEFKWMPFYETMLQIYPKLYSLTNVLEKTNENADVPILNASAEKLSRKGVYIMDVGKVIYFFVGRQTQDQLIQELFNIQNINQLPERMNRLPELNNRTNVEARQFIEKLRSKRQFYSILEIIREDSRNRIQVLNSLLDDRNESSMSYQEFLQHIQRQLNG